MEELRDLLDSSISSKDITIREDDQGNTSKLMFSCISPFSYCN